MNFNHPSERHDPSDKIQHLAGFAAVMAAIHPNVYPVALVAGLAATAVGTGMQMEGAAQSSRAMQRSKEAELLRQKGYQGEADATFKKSLSDSSAAKAAEQLKDGETRRGNAYQQAAAQPIGTPLTTQTASQQVQSSAGAAARTAKTTQATGNAWSKLVSSAQSKLGASEDWGLQQDIKNTRANQDLAITSSNARRSASLLPGEMQIASHKGDGMAGWGQLVSALGSVVGMYGATTAAAAPISSAGTAAHAASTGTAAINYTPAMANSWAALA